MKLLHQIINELQADGIGLLGVAVGRQADAVVDDGQPAAPCGEQLQLDPHPSGPLVGEGVLQGVGDELVDDQAGGDGLVEAELDLVDIGRQIDITAVQPIGADLKIGT